MSNLRLILGIEHFRKFVVGGVGGWWVVESDFNVKLEPQAYQYH